MTGTRHVRGGSLWIGLALSALLCCGWAGAARAAPVDSAAALVRRADAELATRPGSAILDFQRARLLAPRAAAVEQGLARARAAAGLPPADAGPVARAAGRLSPDEWSRLALAALALAALAGTAAAWRLRRRWTGTAAAAALAVALVAGAAAWRTAPRPSDAVVIAPGAVARIAPFAAAEVAFPAPEGASVTILATHEGFTRIRDARGEGWVPSAAVQPILSPS
jgi:hypothetical protein